MRDPRSFISTIVSETATLAEPLVSDTAQHRNEGHDAGYWVPTNDGLGHEAGAPAMEKAGRQRRPRVGRGIPERKQVFVLEVQCDFRNDEWGGMMIPLLVEMMRNDDQ